MSLIPWQRSWFVGDKAGRLFVVGQREVDHLYKQTNKQTNKQKNRQTNKKQKNKQTNRQTDKKQTNKQTNSYFIYIDIKFYQALCPF